MVTRLEEIVNGLNASAADLRARADELDRLARRLVTEPDWDSRIRVASVSGPRAVIRDLLRGVETATELVLMEATGLSKSKLRLELQTLMAEGMVGKARTAGGTVYAWVAPDGRGSDPTEHVSEQPHVPGVGADRAERGRDIVTRQVSKEVSSKTGHRERQRVKRRQRVEQAREARNG